jgi:hypothetical protein
MENHSADKLGPVEIGNICCGNKESEVGLHESGTGFWGCDRWHNKISSQVVLEWSDGPEKSIVMFGAPCAFWEYIMFSRIQVGC